MTGPALDYEFRRIPIDVIDEPVIQARLGMDDTAMDELVDSIRANGVLCPIHVFPVNDRYEVVAGHRRRIAAERARLLRMPCLVFATQDAALEGVKYAENRFREQMSPADEATYFSDLMTKHCENDTNKLAALVGEKRSYVEGRLLLFQGAPEVFKALRERKITIGVAHELNKCSEDLMRNFYLDRAIRDGASISVVTGWIQQWKNSLGPGGAPPAPRESAVASGPSPTVNYFTCYVCGKTHDAHEMQPVMIHVSCKKAILDPLVHGDGGSTSSR